MSYRVSVRRVLPLALCLSLSLALMPASVVDASDRRLDRPHAVEDPAYGQILYEYYQQRYFAAMTTTHIALDSGALPTQADRARVLLGALYVAYGMPDDAQALFETLLAEAVDPQLAARVWIHLAELHYRQQRYDDALTLLDQRVPSVPDDLAEQYHALRIRVLMRLGRFEETVSALAHLEQGSRLAAYLQYNVAVSRINAGQGEQGTALLRALTTLPPGTEEVNAIRDKSLLALGVHYLRQGQPEQAAYYMSFARLEGPYSDLSLLLHARAALAQEQPQRAVGSLQQLTRRSPQREAVQEAALLLPHLHDQLGNHAAALQGYRDAVAAYTGQSEYLNELEQAIHSGAWFAQLVSEPQWSTAMDPLPEFMPNRSDSFPTFQTLFASDAFHAAWQNYHELIRQRRLLSSWQQALLALDSLLAAHQRKHQERVPEALALLATLDAAGLEARLADLFARLDAAIAADDWQVFARADERRLLEALAHARTLVDKWGERVRPASRERLAFYEGLLAWDLQQDIVPRQWQQRKALDEASALLAETDTLRENLLRASRDDGTRVLGYRRDMDRLAADILALDQRGVDLLARQQAAIEGLALAWIAESRPRLRIMTAAAWEAIGDLQERAVRRDMTGAP
ncbi:tetratricopeptide repeat protein [Alcanivorax sp. JB21]|uniref:tetratricopeptide repeat protein n=1 Tax=Alcanivorax limicola TaxID=2874102 RepID=UPI001CBD30D8|nr:tetratricopeptide repeat protein [Alcanivorax limicola]MBZ2190154.1 tetratricopeptide repeat protein [Alcanivorax limicola]